MSSNKPVYAPFVLPLNHNLKHLQDQEHNHGHRNHPVNKMKSFFQIQAKQFGITSKNSFFRITCSLIHN